MSGNIDEITLSVIMPVYNEAATVEAIVKKLRAVPIKMEIIAVDDGSKDKTGVILEKLAAGGLVDKAVKLEKNSGKGAAVRRGLEFVSGNVVVIQDGDLEYDPADFMEMLKPIAGGLTNIVYGSRNMKKNPRSYNRYYYGGVLLSWLTTFLYGSRVTDEATCYKMFRTDVIKRLGLKSSGFDFCPEVTAKALRSGEKIIEVPIKYNPRSIKEGKKIRWFDGVIAIWKLIRYRFLP